MSNFVGTTVGNRYEIIEKIGEGGMATVYKAKCNVLKRKVAIKFLKDEFINDDEFIFKFKNEALSAGSLNQQNIINIYDVSEENNVPYIVMEYIEGENLKEVIKENGKIDKELMLDWSKQIALALKEAHSKKIIHRDIKSQNIMISKNGVKVTDFGIAKAVSSSTITAVGNIMGSVHYFSPEQARGGYIDERSDIYSLGIVMYEMLTGKVPFDGDSPVTIALKHIQEEILFDDFDDTPSEIKDVIRKATQKNPAKRYRTIEDLIDDIEYIQNSKAIALGMGFQDETYKSQIISDDDEFKILFTDLDEENSQKRRRVQRRTPKKSKNNKVGLIGYLLTGFLALILSLSVVGIFYKIKNNKTDIIETPNFVGITFEEAENIAKEYKIQVVKYDEELNSNYEAGKISKQIPEAGTKIKENDEIKLTIVKEEEALVKVPDFADRDIDDVKKEIEELGLEYVVEYKKDVSKVNSVISQVPSSGYELKKGEKIKIIISSGIDESQVKVPNVEGKTLQEAKKILHDAKLGFSVSYRDNQNKQEGVVLSQNPKADTEIEVDSEVSIVINRYEKILYKTVPIIIRFDQNIEKVKVEIIDANSGEIVATKLVSPSEQDGTVAINVQGKPGEVKEYYVYLDGDRTSIYANPTVSFN